MEKSKQKEDFVWRESINKPVYTADGKEIGFVTSI
jgi:rRNA processing protein Gar1